MSANIDFRYSVPTAAGGSQLSQTEDGNNSLGGYVSLTSWPDGVPNSLFPDLSSTDVNDFLVTYRCIFVCNVGDQTLTGASATFATPRPSNSTIQLGVDPYAASPLYQLSQQAEIALQGPPTGVTFVLGDPGHPGVMGDIPPGYCRALWIKRTAGVHGTAIPHEHIIVTVDGQTL